MGYIWLDLAGDLEYRGWSHRSAAQSCAGDLGKWQDDVYVYILNWMAYLLQHPARKCGTALVFKSKQGAGKNIWWEWFGNQVLGRYLFYLASNMELVVGKFSRTNFSSCWTRSRISEGPTPAMMH